MRFPHARHDIAAAAIAAAAPTDTTIIITAISVPILIPVSARLVFIQSVKCNDTQREATNHQYFSGVPVAGQLRSVWGSTLCLFSVFGLFASPQVKNKRPPRTWSFQVGSSGMDSSAGFRVTGRNKRDRRRDRRYRARMTVIPVCAGVIRNGTRVLVARRAPHDSNAGKWEFPGGTVEPGETPEECIRRELTEELSIDTEVIRYLGTIDEPRPDVILRLMFFEMAYRGGEVKLCDHDRYAWATLEALPGYEFQSADQPIVERWATAGVIEPF